jgi:transcription initiation factor TFIID subunit 7
MIMVREPEEPAPEGPEYRHGLTPPMRDARRRRFRREPDLNPELVQQVENDLQSIMAGGTARDVDILFVYVVVFFLLSLGVACI